MNKSVIILLSVVWAMCALYLTLARIYDYPYVNAAKAGSWIASALLLVCIIIYIRKHKRQ